MPEKNPEFFIFSFLTRIFSGQKEKIKREKLKQIVIGKREIGLIS